MKSRFSLNLHLILITLVYHSVAFAQTGGALEEIIITADFFSTPLMQSSTSVSTLSEQFIRDRGAQHLEEAFSSAPNLNWSSAAARARFIQLRGIGDLEQFQDPKYYPSVGINLNNIELGANAAAASLFDIKQVEILRGPQGTRFGSSGHAGLINLQSSRPDNEPSSSLSAGFGNYGQQNMGGIISGPLSKSLLGRLSLQQNAGNGFIQNRFLGTDDSNGYREQNIHGNLRWQVTESLELDAFLIHFNSRNGYDSWTLDSPRQTSSDQPGHDDTRLNALSLNAIWSLDSGYELSANISSNNSNNHYAYDADWVNSGFCDADPDCNAFDFDQAQEGFERHARHEIIDLRLSSPDERLVAGFYAKHNQEDLSYRYLSLWYGNYLSDSAYRARRYALYGQYKFPLSANLNILAGLRYEHFSDDYRDTNLFSSDTSDRLWGGELSMEYFVNDTLLYASVSQSEKPGGVNTSASANAVWMSPAFQLFTADKLRFDKETLLNKEVGLKRYFLDDAVSMRATLFHTNRSQAQLESWMWDAGAGLWIGYLDSTSDAVNYGFELETDYQPNNKVEFFLGLGLLKTDVEEISVFDLDLNNFRTLYKRDQVKAPAWQYTLGARFSLSERLTLNTELEARDESYFGYYHEDRLKGYRQVHASLGYALENIQLSLWARNLTNEAYAVHGLYFAADARNGWQNESYLQYGAPRTFGLNASYTF